MGGDEAPASIIDGALVAARHLQVGLLLVGRRDLIERQLSRHPRVSWLDIDIQDTSERIEIEEAAAAALRRKPRASIRVAAEAVADGRAQALFSAGHTGASVMAAHAAFGRLPGVDRPALATIIPTRTRPAVLLDSGATVECRPHHLVQFAIMGVAYARVALGCATPRVGLLSVGAEESKGNELTREAHRLLKAAPVNFVGNVEGPDVFAGHADVIVCDGFTGNITLKVSEGLVETVESLLHDELSSTFGTRVGYLLSRRRSTVSQASRLLRNTAAPRSWASMACASWGTAVRRPRRSGMRSRWPRAVSDGFLQNLAREVAAPPHA